MSVTSSDKRFKSIAQDFLDYMSVERGASPLTIEAYRRDICRYLDFLVESGLSEFDQVQRGNVTDYLGALNELGYAPASVERAVSAVKSFHRFAVRENLAEHDPTATVRLPQVPDTCQMSSA